MKYEKAKDVLPKELLKEVQKYAAGKLLYIPSGDEKRTWGEASGYRQKLQKRNQMICNKYASGTTISELADEYFLSLESIKKIVYTKKKDGILDYEPTLQSALEFTNAGMMEEWIHSYLICTRRNDDLSKQLMTINPYYYGPAKLPLRLIRDFDKSKIDNNHDSVENHNTTVVELVKKMENNKSLPPLIIEFDNGKFIVNEYIQLFDELKECKINAYPVYIWITGIENYKIFMDHFGKHLRMF
jgi:hypothetical protein